MDPPHRIYRGAVRTLSVVFIAIGLTILATTIANGGGPIATGTFLGMAFIGIGIARLWLSGSFRGWREGRGQASPQRPRPPRDGSRG